MPTFSTDIPNVGSWTRDRIVNATKSKEGRTLLSQSLYACVHKFLPTTRLMHLSAQTIKDVGNDHQEQQTQTSRFEIAFGNHDNHVEDCKNNDELDSDNFSNLLTKFYIENFSADEKASIEKVLDYKKAPIQHIIIYYCYLQPSRKQQVVRKKCIAGASTFIITSQGCYLLYVAISYLYLPASIKSKPTQLAKEAMITTDTKQPLRLRHYELGLLSLSLTQHVSYCINYNYSMVCEASLGDEQNAFFFYKRLLFNQVDKNHFMVSFMNERYPELAHHANNLKWLVLVGNSIASTNTRMLYGEKTKLIDTRRAANFARDTVCGNTFMETEYDVIKDFIISKQQLIQKLLREKIMIEIKHSSTTRSRRSRNTKIASIDRLKEIICKSHLESVSESDVHVDEEFVALTDNIGDNASFQCLSKIVFGDENRFQKIRELLSYVNKSIVSFRIDANHFNIHNDNVEQFCKDAFNAVRRMEKCFDNDDDAAFLDNYQVVSGKFDEILAAKNSVHTIFSVFWSLTNVLHHQKFIPGTYEFRLIASLFKLRINVVEGQSSENDLSKWYLKEAEVFHPYHILQQNSSINDLTDVYVLRDDRRNYYFIESRDKQHIHLDQSLFDKPNSESEVEYTQLISYFNSQNKHIEDNFNQYKNLIHTFNNQDMVDFRIVGCHPNILSMILHHPFSGNEQKPVKNCNTMIAGFQSLNAGIWIDDSVIHAFFEVNRHRHHAHTWIVTPFEAFQFRSQWFGNQQKPFCNHTYCQQKREQLNTFYCKDYDKKFKQCRMFSAVVNFQTTHWVVLEFELKEPRKSTDQFKITVIDSMVKEKGVSYNNQIDQFDINFLLLISLLVITEKNHPQEPFILNNSVNPVWMSFFKKSLNFVSTHDDHPIQPDSHNCGPYCVNWVYRRLLNEHDNQFFDSSLLYDNDKHLRLFMMKQIITKSGYFETKWYQNACRKLNEIENEIQINELGMNDLSDNDIDDIDFQELKTSKHGEQYITEQSPPDNLYGEIDISYNKIAKTAKNITVDIISDDDILPDKIPKETSKPDFIPAKNIPPDSLKEDATLPDEIHEETSKPHSNQVPLKKLYGGKTPRKVSVKRKYIDKEDDDDNEENVDKEHSDNDEEIEKKPKKQRIYKYKFQEDIDPTWNKKLRKEEEKVFSAWEEYTQQRQITVPDHRMADVVDRELSKTFIGRKKQDLTQRQRQNWRENAFDPSQTSILTAKNALRKFHRKKLATLKSKFDQSTDNSYKSILNQVKKFKGSKKALDQLEKKRFQLHKQWIKEKTEILLLEQDLKELPLIHVRDRIKAIRVNDKTNRGRQHKLQYIAYVENENNQMVEKEVSADWLQKNVEPEYFKLLEEHHYDKGWVAFDKDKPTLVNKNEELKDAFKSFNFRNIYEYRPTANDTWFIVWLRFAMRVKYNKNNELEYESIDYHFKHTGSSNEYRATTRNSLLEVISQDILDLYQASAFDQIKKRISDQNSGVKNIWNDVLYDRKDSLFNETEAQQGDVRFTQLAYVNVRDKHYGIAINKNQISRIKYNPITEKWFGFEKEADGSKVVELEEWWVNENLTGDQKEYLIDIAKDENKQFVKIPVQDIIDIVPTMDITGNPSIQYMNNESGVCAYASFASALYSFGFVDEGTQIMNLSEKASENVNMQFDPIRTIILGMEENQVFKFFRKIFLKKKIKKKLSVDDMNESIKQDDAFALVVLEQTDNHMSHAVVVSKNHIYDCNTTNAMPFTLEGLNCCCGKTANFKSFHSGYIFVPRCENKTYIGWKRLKKCDT